MPSVINFIYCHLYIYRWNVAELRAALHLSSVICICKSFSQARWKACAGLLCKFKRYLYIVEMRPFLGRESVFIKVSKVVNGALIGSDPNCFWNRCDNCRYSSHGRQILWSSSNLFFSSSFPLSDTSQNLIRPFSRQTLNDDKELPGWNHSWPRKDWWVGGCDHRSISVPRSQGSMAKWARLVSFRLRLLGHPNNFSKGFSLEILIFNIFPGCSTFRQIVIQHIR